MMQLDYSKWENSILLQGISNVYLKALFWATCVVELTADQHWAHNQNQTAEVVKS